MEIERKFLVIQEEWNKIEKPKPIYIKQGYISKDEKGVVRVRIKDEKAFLTIKSKTVGIVRNEFEYEIPKVEAEHLFELFIDKWIEKNRFEVIFEGQTWEVDEFIEPKQSFILAEIELSDEYQHFSIPKWIGKEVSHDKLYFNSNLI